jgi:phage replication initiation protein
VSLQPIPGQSGAGILSGRWMLNRSCIRGTPPHSPRPVTRGESTPVDFSVQRAKIDWLNATFPAPSMSLAGMVAFIGDCCMGQGVSAVLEGGLFGFAERHRLFIHLEGSRIEIGALALGGESQQGKWLLQLTGKGCGVVEDWASLRELLEGLGATITRLDLALDFLQGEHTVDDAMDMLEAGQFTSKGRTPSSMQMGDWHKGKDGRTLYVGKAKNGKMLRVYEKGKQLQSMNSEWVRFEVQLGNRDRVIPFDAITEPDRYFAGAYPALESLIQVAAEAIPTTQTETLTNLGHLLHHLRRCYGKALHQAQETCAVSHTDLVEEMRVIGMPRRVDPAGVVAGLEWPQLQAQLRSYGT